MDVVTFPNGETVTRLRVESTVDEWNNPVHDWSSASELDIPGCGIAPGSSTENNVDRSEVATVWTVYVPTDQSVDVLPTDRIRARGVVYEVAGRPAEWVSPWDGVRRGWVIDLRNVEG